MLQEIYDKPGVGTGEGRWWPIRRLSAKRMSDMLGEAAWQERDLQLAHMERTAENDDARKTAHAQRKKHRERFAVPDREDLLPFILYVAERRYMEHIDYNMDCYRAEDAREFFVHMADKTLTDCRMPKLSERYEADSILLQCFQENGMYLYSDVMEAVEEI